MSGHLINSHNRVIRSSPFGRMQCQELRGSAAGVYFPSDICARPPAFQQDRASLNKSPASPKLLATCFENRDVRIKGAEKSGRTADTSDSCSCAVKRSRPRLPFVTAWPKLDHRVKGCCSLARQTGVFPMNPRDACGTAFGAEAWKAARIEGLRHITSSGSYMCGDCHTEASPSCD